jgi:hypothetical protein
MTVLITLTIAGTDSGPFDLYSDLDGYTSAFESGVPKASLLAGYASALVPDYTNIIRVKSNGDCVNYIDIPLPGYTTTTTTTILECIQYSADAAGFPGTIYYTDCSGNPQEFFIDTIFTFCAIEGTVTTGGPIISIIGSCLLLI